MSGLKTQAEEEDCEPCRFAVGIAMHINICNELQKDGKDIDCDDLAKAVNNEDITVREFVEQIGERIKATGDTHTFELYDEVRDIMFKKRGMT